MSFSIKYPKLLFTFIAPLKARKCVSPGNLRRQNDAVKVSRRETSEEALVLEGFLSFWLLTLGGDDAKFLEFMFFTL